MKRFEVDPDLVAAVVSELRRRVRPVKGRRLAAVLRVAAKRRIEEAIWVARCRGHRIVSGPQGYQLTRSRAAVETYVAREERRMARERKAIYGVKRGRPPQCQVPVTRLRRAA